MKIIKFYAILFLVTGGVFLSACGVREPKTTEDRSLLQTQIAQTIVAEITQAAVIATNTFEPPTPTELPPTSTSTVEPSSTPTLTSTPTLVPLPTWTHSPRASTL